MPEIIPAILTNDQEIFKRQVTQSAKFGAKTIQVDFTDRQFVSSRTLLPDQLDSLAISQSDLIFEAHLMTAKPEQYFSTLYGLGFKRVAPHIQVVSEPGRIISLARDLSLEIGLALNPEVKLKSVEPWLNQLDFILFLTVQPGQQGRRLEPAVLDKMSKLNQQILQEKYQGLVIEADGGIKTDNIQSVVKAGASRLVVGSGLWQTDNPSKSYQQLATLVQASL